MTSTEYVAYYPLKMLSLMIYIRSNEGRDVIETVNPSEILSIAHSFSSAVYIINEDVGSKVLGFQIPSHLRVKGVPRSLYSLIANSFFNLNLRGINEVGEVYS